MLGTSYSGVLGITSMFIRSLAQIHGGSVHHTPVVIKPEREREWTLKEENESATLSKKDLLNDPMKRSFSLAFC